MSAIQKMVAGARKCRLLALPALLAGLLSAQGAPPLAPENPKFTPLPPCPALVAAAITNRIPLSGMDSLSATNGLHPGDSVTLLGAFVQKQSRAQWLLHVEVSAPSPGQKPARKPEPMTVTMDRTNFVFESKPVPAKLRLLGPFAADGASQSLKAVEKTAEFSLNESFLGLGLEQAAEVLWKWSQIESNAPPSGEKKSKSETPKSTPAEDRALAGSIPALMSYLQIVQHTEGLEDILLKLVKLPSVWSIIRHGGIRASLVFGDDPAPVPANPKDWDLPPTVPVYYFPCLLSVNDEPAVKITLVVTRPTPPLLICGGVVGVLAEKVGDDESYMTLRLVSARYKPDEK